MKRRRRKKKKEGPTRQPRPRRKRIWEISSVNHTTPSPSAPPTQGRVQLSDDQRRENKRETDKRSNKKRKRNEAELKKELETLKEKYVELKSENGNIKSLRDQRKDLVDEENKKILSKLVDNSAGQNTEVQKARVNKIGEMSTGQDALNELREVNQAPVTSNSISGENASMNLQTLPRSGQPAGSSGLADDKQARRRITDKIRRDKRKCKLEEDAARIKEFKEKIVELELENAVLKAEANQLGEHLDQLRNISEKMAFKDARRNAKLGKDVDGSMQKIEDMERQLEKVRADYDELKKSHDELSKAHAYSNGLVDQAKKDMEQIAGFNRGWQQIVERQNAWNDMHQQLLVAGTTGIDTGEIGLPVHHPTINQSGATMESGGRVIAESLPQLYQVGLPYPPLSDCGLTPGADSFDSHGFNYTSPPGAAMVSSSSLMERPFAPGGQLPIEVIGFGTGETGLPVHHFGTTMGSGGLAIEDSSDLLQSLLSQGWTHGNNSEQPTSYNADQSPGVD